MAKNNETDHNTINLIGTGTTISGEINATGDIRIDGNVSGNIKTKGKLVVGNTGEVEGEILCQNADISGKVNAKMEVKELLTLKASAHYNGEITVSQLAIEPGAIFSGSCNMEKPSIASEKFSKGEAQPSQSK